MWVLLVAFAVSLAVTLLVIRASRGGRHAAHDSDLSGPQKFHARPVPRIGGVGIFAGIVGAAAVLLLVDRGAAAMVGLLLLCGAPCFLAGLAEDYTKRISPRRRLFFTAVSGALAVWLLQAAITHTAIPGLDWVVAMPVGAALVTVFVVTGVANSVNIIDGFNGLSSMCCMLILAAVAYVAFQVDDSALLLLALAGIGALMGFFIWNYPAGLVFVGDGGAYFIGFYTAELAILLLHRNPQVSPMFPLLACIYPVFETLFSIYRRRWLRDQSPGVPDGIHLHSLIYRRVVRWAAGAHEAKALTRRNSMTSPYLWLLCMCAVVPAMLFWSHTGVLAGFIVLFSVGYTMLYWRIVRFRAPRWMVIHSRPGDLGGPQGSGQG
ncbi:MAG: glycosyl transferase [Ideonella sp.]|nr:glycosyl transferase [Ideonella sp.]MCC7456913.1 glycosyltransferase family 4 protein [Nitrospira sp.]